MGDMDTVIADVFRIFHEKYSTRMKTFRPCKPHGEIVENNLVHQFINSWLVKYPDAIHAVEVPFATQSETELTPETAIKHVQVADWGNHLDAIILSQGILYLIEAKRDRSPAELIKEIKKEYDRIYSLELALSLNKMFFREGVYETTNKEIKEVKGIIIADTWRATNVELWGSGSYLCEIEWLSSMKRDLKDLMIKSGNNNESYHLLIAHTAPIATSLRGINFGV
jgi:hypothetical protein